MVTAGSGTISFQLWNSAGKPLRNWSTSRFSGAGTMKTNMRVYHHETGWAQLSGCASCPSCPSETFEVGQRKLLKSCDCLRCPRCPGEISNLYRAVSNDHQPLSHEVYKQNQNHPGHLGQVGQSTEMMMEKLSQENEIPGTGPGQKAGEKHSEAQRAGAIEGFSPSLVGLLLPLALVLREPLFQQNPDGFRPAVYPVAETKVIQSLNEFLISYEYYFGLLCGHSVLIPGSGEGCKRNIDKLSFISYITNISLHFILNRRF